MIRAVFFDIDGTLVSFRTHEVPFSARYAIKRLREKGIKVFIATGRHLMAINNLGDLEFDGYVTLNGGLCYAGKGETTVYKHPIPHEDVGAFLDYMEQHPLPCVFVREHDMYLNFSDERVEEVFRMLNFIRVPMADLRTKADEEVMQFIAFFGKESEEELMRCLPHCRATRWFHTFSDIVPSTTSKTVGIYRLCAHYGIAPEEIMAFGDGGNDIEMLRDMALGVAMGNAEEEVKEVADYVTSSVDDDGVYRALCHFGLLEDDFRGQERGQDSK